MYRVKLMNVLKYTFAEEEKRTMIEARTFARGKGCQYWVEIQDTITGETVIYHAFKNRLEKRDKVEEPIR